MKRIKSIVLLSSCFLVLSGCGYIEPFDHLGKASTAQIAEDYVTASEHYEQAVEGFASKPFMKPFECEARYPYAFALEMYDGEWSLELSQKMRANAESIIECIGDSDDSLMSMGTATFSLAKAIHLEADYTEDDESYYLLLEEAYSTFESSVIQLEASSEWQTMAYATYNLGRVAADYGDLETAISWLEQTVELDETYGFYTDLDEDMQYLAELKEAYETSQE